MWILKSLLGAKTDQVDNADVQRKQRKSSESDNASVDKCRAEEDDGGGVDDTSVLEGALYSVSGLQFKCLMPHCTIEVVKHSATTATIVISEVLNEPSQDEDENGEIRNHQNDTSKVSGRSNIRSRDSRGACPTRLDIPLHTISNFQQHLTDGFQFLVKRKKDHAEEFGLQLHTEGMALVFRHIVEPYMSATAAVMVCLPCAFAWYDTTTRTFTPISRTAQCAIAQRHSDLEAFLIVREGEGSDNHHTAPDEILFQDVLSPAMNLWTIPSVGQVVFWGPALKTHEVGERRMFMVELLVEEDDPLNVDFFQLLAIVLRERIDAAKLTDDQKKTIEETVEGNMRRRRKPATTESEDDSSGSEAGMFGFDEEMRRGSDDDFDVQMNNNGSGQVCWRWSNENTENGSSDEDDNDSSPVVSRDPSRKIAQRNPEVLMHKFMEVGSNRTFVCRGTDDSVTAQARASTELQLYKPTGDSRQPLSSAGQISGNKFQFGVDRIFPTRGILHDQEKKLILQSDSRPTEVFMMDLERETVVQKWDTEYQKIHNMLPTFKHGQSTHDPTFLCHNDKSFFLMDSRLSGKGRTTSFGYTTNPQFATAATDIQGHVLLGSKLGTMRLYDGEPNRDGEFKRAKTQLDTVREPLTAVDVNSDGSWIVGTTRSYLVVFPTRLTSSGKTGFETSLGKHKPKPRYLCLKAHDIQNCGLTDINFTAAKFSSDETSIVSSTGNLAVIWDMSSIRRGRPVYRIKKATDFIKDVQMSTDDASVVVAYPQDLGLFGTARRSVGS